MIISHRYKFIFIKSKKTAGSSLEIALSQYMGAGDVVTLCSPTEEAMRRELGYQEAVNFHIPFYRYQVKDWKRKLLGRSPGYYNHVPAKRIKQLLGAKIWDSYYKFCVERDPLEKVVSAYYFRAKARGMTGTLSEYIASSDLERLRNEGGSGLYFDGDELLVDDVFAYSDLAQVVTDLPARLGLPGPLKMPHAKSGIRRDNRHAEVILTQQEQDRIASIFTRERRVLGLE